MRWVTNRSLGRNTAERHGYFAGTDEQRLADLNGALRDPDVAAIWCIRGGYGTTRILDRVDFDALARRPKPLIGYSDITAILNAVTRRTGVVTFHAPMARAAMPPFSRRHFERVLATAEPAGRLERLPEPADVLLPRENRIATLARRRGRGAARRAATSRCSSACSARPLPRSRRRDPLPRGRGGGSLPGGPHAGPPPHGRRARPASPASPSAGSPSSSAP